MPLSETMRCTWLITACMRVGRWQLVAGDCFHRRQGVALVRTVPVAQFDDGIQLRLQLCWKAGVTVWHIHTLLAAQCARCDANHCLRMALGLPRP